MAEPETNTPDKQHYDGNDCKQENDSRHSLESDPEKQEAASAPSSPQWVSDFKQKRCLFLPRKVSQVHGLALQKHSFCVIFKQEARHVDMH